MFAILIPIRVLVVMWCVLIKVNNSTGEFLVLFLGFPASRRLIVVCTILYYMLSAAAVYGNDPNGMCYISG